jgi:hypothetical protein
MFAHEDTKNTKIYPLWTWWLSGALTRITSGEARCKRTVNHHCYTLGRGENQISTQVWNFSKLF